MSEEFELKFKVSLDGKEDLPKFFSQSERGARAFSDSLSRTMANAGKTMSSFAASAKGALGQFAGGTFNQSIASQARGVLQFRDAISALAVMAGKGNESVGELKTQIQDVSKASNQLQGDVTEALAAFVEKTGDLDTARRNIELYGKTATATGAALQDVARVGVELSQKLDVKTQANSFAILAAQAKAGAIELKDLARYGPRLLAASASVGATGEMGVREAGALAQVVAQGFGGKNSAAMVTTSIENMFAALKKGKKRAAIENIVGHDISGSDAFDTLKELIAKSKGDKTILQDIFTMQGIRGVEVLAREFRKTGGFATFDKFRDIVPRAGLIEGDFATRTQTGEAKVKRQEIRNQHLVDQYLGGAAEFAAEHASEIGVGAHAMSAAGTALSLLGRAAGGRGGKIGGALTNLTAQRVFVVNWPGGGIPGVGGNPASNAAKDGLLSRAITAVTGIGLAQSLALAAPVAIGAGALYSVHRQKAALVDQLVNGTNAADARDRELSEQRRKGIGLTRRRNEPIIAPAGGSLGTLGENGDVVNAIREHSLKNVTINIHGDQATVDGEGTRSPRVMVRRTAAAGS